MAELQFDRRDEDLQRRIALLEQRLNHLVDAPQWPRAIVLVVAGLAGALLGSVPLSELGAAAARQPWLTGALALLLLAAAGITWLSLTAARRLGERGEEMRLFADDLSRRLSEPLTRRESTPHSRSQS